MAQRSITSFFGAKSPPSSSSMTTVEAGSEQKTPVLGSPSNKQHSKEKSLTSPKKDQPLLVPSPQKMMIISPKKVAEKSPVKEIISDDNSSENNTPVDAVKIVRKRRRISSSSSSEDSHSSLSTAFDGNSQAVEAAVETKNKDEVKEKVTKKKSPKAAAKAPPPKKRTPAKPSSASKPKAKSTAAVSRSKDGKPAKKESRGSPAKEKTKATKDEPKLMKEETKPNDTAEKVAGDYDPTQSNYDPISHATWKSGENTPFLCWARTLDYAEKTSSRLRTMETVANFFASVTRLSPADLPATVYLCLGVVAPAHLGIETSVGEGVLLKAMAAATGRPIAKIRTDLQQKGDIGEVAETSRHVQRQLGFGAKPKALTINGVFTKLREIAAMHGASSVNQRVETISRLLTICQPVEAKFLVRLLTGKLRVGLAEQSVLIALGQSAIYSKCKSSKERSKYWEDKSVIDSVAKSVRLAFAHCPDVDRLTQALLSAINSSEDDLVTPLLRLPERCPIVPGLPVKPMLAQPAKSLHEIVEKLGTHAKDETDALEAKGLPNPGRLLACEFKYDGERAQIHVFMPSTSDNSKSDEPPKPTVRIFSRNQEDHTVRFSEVANRIAEEAVLPSARGFSLIIDSEIVAVDPNGRHLPFQMLAARKRKEPTAEEEAKAQKKEAAAKEPPAPPAYRPIAFVFDCIYINGESLVNDTLLERRRKIAECIKPIDGLVEWAKSVEVDIDKDEHEVEERVGSWLDEAVKAGCEGLIVKTATSRYMVARRAPCWLKLKKDYIETEAGSAGTGGDGVDLVVVAGYWGSGKRTGRLGAFLLASYDPMSDRYETVCKLGTGLSDELLESLTPELMPLARASGAPPPSYVNHSPGLPEPNVWLEPSVVWEIRAADLSLSNIHTSGLGSIPGAPDRGVSLRFPRYVRGRPDKKAEEATTSEDMCRRYANQQQVQHVSEGKTKAAVDDDFY